MPLGERPKDFEEKPLNALHSDQINCFFLQIILKECSGILIKWIYVSIEAES